VDLDLTDEQKMFHVATRKFLEHMSPMAHVRDLWGSESGFDRSAWRQAAELGWFVAFADEQDGGGSVSGRPVVDASIVAEEVGRALFPGPVVPKYIVAYAIAQSASSVLRAEHLPGPGTSTESQRGNPFSRICGPRSGLGSNPRSGSAGRLSWNGKGA
jgi:alkylation response protein AidB-like acyl-CoA dehydrogenase